MTVPSTNPPAPQFVHLRAHSQYSLEDGLAHVDALAVAARSLGMPAVAMTDWHNLFGLVKFYKAARKHGIKPIIGADLRLSDPVTPQKYSVLTLLVANRTGYLNLCRLLSRSFIEGRQSGGQPRIGPDWLDQDTDGLVMLTGWAGDVGRALANHQPQEARRRLEDWRTRFGDRLYIDLQRTGRSGEQETEPGLLELAVALEIPVVASNDVRFLTPEQFLAHEARVCIHEGRLLDDKRRVRAYTDQQYLKSPSEMHVLFADLPAALENTVQLACRLNFELQLGQYALPRFPLPEEDDVDHHLTVRAAAGLQARIGRYGLAPARSLEDYERRIEQELEVIIKMGFSGYFLIVADFIAWARNNGVPVGPGRGSGAGSLVAWALEITDPDPLRYDLLFERFLNPERVSMPDFDIDFCVAGRDRVIDYVAERYGRDQVSQIITYGTLAAKAAVRDCGRVLGHNYGFVDSIAKLIPMQLDITLQKALSSEPELRQRFENEDDTRSILELAMQLEGVARNAGKHAGGVVIAPGPLVEYAPLYTDPRSGSVVTQFDKNDIEAIGLVKFDFLGLRNLTIIDWAMRAANTRRAAQGEPPLVLELLPLDDAETYVLLQQAHTTAVFQLESRGMKDLLRRLRPDHFDDIVAAVALFRPGPLDAGMVDDYVERKHGRATVRYPHPLTEPILAPTYGVILYQEQVMQIAQVVAGYTLGAADLLRRAMGKKDREAMARQRAVFADGALQNGVTRAQAEHLFDLIETFAGYGFNKSHSVAYALIAYRTAYLKAHYPAEFMAAVLSSDLDKTDKVANLVEDCRAMGLHILPPDINRSGYHFQVEDGAIRYGLGAIKGLGEGAVENLITVRTRIGSLDSLERLCRELDLGRLNRRALETLIRSGACDSIDPNRAALLQRLPEQLVEAEQYQADREAGQASLFSPVAPSPHPVDARRQASPIPAWTTRQRLRAERETLGLYLSGHPMDGLREELACFSTCTLEKISERFSPATSNGGGRRQSQTMTLAGLVLAIRRRPGRGGFLALGDGTGRLEVAVFDPLYSECADRLASDEIVVVSGRVESDEFSGGFRMIADQVLTLDQARARHARHLKIEVRPDCAEIDRNLAAAMRPYRQGKTPVILVYHGADARALLRLGDEWRVEPCAELLAALGGIDGVIGARLGY